VSSIDVNSDPHPGSGRQGLSTKHRLIVAGALGLLGVAALAVVPSTWETSRGTLAVGLRAYLLEWVGLAAGFGCLTALALSRGKRLAALQVPVPEAFQLSEEEHAIIASMAADPFSMSESEIAEAAGLSGNRFKLHWHRVLDELKLAECEERRPGAELFVLSQSGRRYALERGLL
jgi:hypothetical protein